MIAEMRQLKGRVLTVRGPVEPETLGAVMMHEHLHADLFDWEKNRVVTREKPPTPERRKYLLEDAVPLLKQCRDFGMHAYCDVSNCGWRGWPTLYREVSELSGIHIILATGFYREIEVGKYFVKKRADAIWPPVRNWPEDRLAEMCIREISEGIHGTDVRAGVIKLGTSQAPMTPAEKKAFRAAARAQIATGVHITTHCTQPGAESSQLSYLEDQGVDLRRVVIGHTQDHLMDQNTRRTCLEWMKRGANFMPTNLAVREWLGEHWRPLVEAIHEVFDAGHGDKLVLGLDSGYTTESGAFGPMPFLPPHPWTHLFRNTLPAFRAMGLKPEEEKAIMVTNPQRIIPVR
jgi:phosphotriesterase-related protein